MTTAENLQLFLDILTGDFDNSAQVEAELQAGRQIHPLARHVNRIFTHRVLEKPADFSGEFLLEESYYQYPDQPLDIKPLLFWVKGVSESEVQLASMKMPVEVDKASIRNNNPETQFRFSELQVSHLFKPAIYSRNGQAFTVNNPNDWGDGKTFTLIETLTKDRLEVMELLEQNGVRLTPYGTPILYDRLPQSDQ